MKKLICLLLALLTVIACVPVLSEQESKALVLYFDYSENIDTTGLDVDAISQASMAGTRARDNSNLLVMDIKDAAWFTERNARSQHGGGGLAAREADTMNWLFSQRKENP